MKKLYLLLIIMLTIIIQLPLGFSQQPCPVLVIIETNNFELLYEIDGFRVYYHDCDYAVSYTHLTLPTKRIV